MAGPNTSTTVQYSFGNDDNALCLSESTDITGEHYHLCEYEHDNKLANRELQKYLEHIIAMREAEERAAAKEKQVLLQWKIASHAVEAYAVLLWDDPLAIPETHKARLAQVRIDNAITLRFQSFVHEQDSSERSSVTQTAFEIYTAIPVEYRVMFDDLVQSKNRIASIDRLVITHAVIQKSQIEEFLRPHIAASAHGPVAALLGKMPDVKFWFQDWVYGPLFKEG